MKFRKTISLVLSTVILSFIGIMFAGCSVNDAQNSNQEQIAEMQNNYQEQITEMQSQINVLQNRIDDLEKEMEKEEFFTLLRAYGKGWLTIEDLQTIADYHHGVVPCEEKLGDNVEKALKQDWAKKSVADGKLTEEQASEDHVFIHKYYGTYNKCVVVVIDCGEQYPAVYAPLDVEIGGITFTFQLYGPSLAVWKM